MGCEQCQGGCAMCKGTNSLDLTEEELELLRQFGQIPFVPMRKNKETGKHTFPDAAARNYVFKYLWLKKLIRFDDTIPLQNYDYKDPEDLYEHGSAALTARGQQVLEMLEIQGVSEEDEA